MSNPEPKRPVETLQNILDAGSVPTADAIRSSRGNAFLVCTGPRMLRVPSGPMETAKLSGRAVRKVAENKASPYSPLFEVRHTRSSPYSFITLGRTGNCDIYVPDESISKLHAIFRESGDLLVIHDADSHNGTEVNGEPAGNQAVGGITLTPGDVVKLGSVTTQFVQAEGLHEMLAELAGIAQTAEADASAEPDLRTPVLVVHHRDAVREGINERLEAAGYRAYGVASPVDASVGAVRWRPSLVLVAHPMPGVHGGRICQTIKQAIPDARVLVLLVADDMGEVDADVWRAKYGVDGLLTPRQQRESLISFIVQALETE